MRFWVWSFPGAQDGHDRCLRCLGIQHAEEAFVDGSCSSSKERKKKKGGHDHLGVAYKLRCVKHGGVPMPLPRFSVRPGTRPGGAASGGVRGDWGSRWGLPKRSSSPLKRSAAGTGYTARFLRCFPWRPDVDRCIGGRALSLRGWRPGCVAPFGCGSVVRARPRDDGYAFPGRRECRARVEKKKSTASRSFEAGRVVSRWGPLWCHSSRKCMRSSQDRGRHLSLPETYLVAPPPSPPSTVEPLWGTWAPPWWSSLWPCNCVQQPLPPCGVTRVSPHGPVGISQV